LQVEESVINGLKVKMFYLNNLIIGIPTEIGPRILYIAHKMKPKVNLFKVIPESKAQRGTEVWQIYGGHRLWASPEAMPRTYSLDNSPVKVKISGENVTIYGNPETSNFIQKQIELKPLAEKGVAVVHSIKNIGRWPISFGCWALSVMPENGFATIPMSPSKVDEQGLLPDRHMSLWPYTDLSDKRLKMMECYIFVKPDADNKKPCKIGAMANPSWTAYWADGTAFVKSFTKEEGEYPDYGCSVEIYTNNGMLELETLGPIKTVQPNQCLQYVETWNVMNIPELSSEPQSVRDKLEPLLSQ
jgi:hypothetical protein